MKMVFRIQVFLLLAAGLLSCEDEPVPPVVTTAAVTDITTFTAVTGGSVTDRGGANVTERGVCWSTSENPTVEDHLTTDIWDDSVNLSFTSVLTELTPNTRYYVRAYATNVGGTGYGNTESFTTLGDAPSTVTIEASDITINSATLNGTVNAGLLTTTVSFEYGSSTDYGNTVYAEQSPLSSDSTVNVSAALTGLAPGTEYHYRVSAENSLGTVYGEDMSYTTNGDFPEALTTDATGITMNTAVLNGTVNPNYLETDVVFEWGSTADYGNIILPSQSSLSGSSAVNISATITGLSPASTYHFRIRATNEMGTTYSNDLIFITYAVADADNNLYRSVTIGTQTWLQENLMTTHFNDGSDIPSTAGNTEWAGLSSAAYCFYDNDEEYYKDEYGILYNWYCVKTGKLCPSGWHVPSNGEWITLTNFLGGENNAGNKLKESGNIHWGDLNTATNETGFTALPGGYRTEDGAFASTGLNAYFWSSSILLSSSSYSAVLYNNSGSMSRTGMNNISGLSVRCIKD